MKKQTRTRFVALLPLLLSLSLSSCLAKPKVKAKGIDVTKEPDKTQYYEGDLFDPTGIEVSLVYSDGSEEPVDFADCNYDLKDPLTLDNTYVVILYENYMTDVKIQVAEDTPLEATIQTMPNQLVYSAGEVFNPAGLSLEVKKASGRKEVVTYSADDERFSFDKTPLVATMSEVTISFAGLSLSIPITFAFPYTEFGGYLEHCKEVSQDPVLAAQAILPFGGIRYTVNSKDYGEIKGSATDGTYFYAVSSASEKGTDCRLLKINPQDGSLLGYSGAFTTRSGYDIPLLLKDGVLTVNGSTEALDFSLADFATEGDGTSLSSSKLSFTQDGAAVDLSTILDWEYNTTQKKYLVLVNGGKILVYGDDLALESTLAVKGTGKVNSDDLWDAHLSTTDSYIYLSYHNLWLQPHQNPVLSVYDFQGNAITENRTVPQDVLKAQSWTRLTDAIAFGDGFYVFYSNPSGSPVVLQPGLLRIYTTEKKSA